MKLSKKDHEKRQKSGFFLKIRNLEKEVLSFTLFSDISNPAVPSSSPHPPDTKKASSVLLEPRTLGFKNGGYLLSH
jgi:hypothetical protein